VATSDGSIPPPTQGAFAQAARVWLRFNDYEVELAQGETIVGRSPKCQLVMDDPLVSRAHARIFVNGAAVTIEDMGSSNGVLVNGERLARARVIVNGDRVVIGQQSFVLGTTTAAREDDDRKRTGAQTLSGFQSWNEESKAAHDQDRSEATRKSDALELLAGVAEKVLALGRGDEAERILGSYLRNMLLSARSRGDIDAGHAEKAATYAVRIAEVTGKGAWVDYAFELYTVLKRPLPAPIVERLYEALRKLQPVSVTVFRQYLAALRTVESQFGPSDRFLLRRLEGLESLGAMR
jgi:pSer/pThr/pTyr-binding forkhead associated (FHA) protein